MKNLATYGTIILLFIAIYMLIKQGKLMSMQTSLLVAMAGQMGIKFDGKKKEEGEEQHTETRELTEEEKDEIIIKEMTRISDLIKEKQFLNKKDEAYYKKYIDEMHEDLQLASPDEIVKEKKPEHKRLTADEKKKLILTFFDDNKAKIVPELSKMLADASGTKPNEGNTTTLLNALVANKELNKQEIKHGIRKKMFYAPVDWFDGKKIKKEYLPA